MIRNQPQMRALGHDVPHEEDPDWPPGFPRPDRHGLYKTGDVIRYMQQRCAEGPSVTDEEHQALQALARAAARRRVR